MTQSAFGSGLTLTQQAIARAIGADDDWTHRALFLQNLDKDQLWKEASENDLESQIAHVLIESSDREEVEERWVEAHAKTFLDISGYLRELERIGTRLEAAGIPMVALKNAGIALFIHGCPGCCPMGDVDVLIKREDFFEAHKLLIDDGYEFEFRSPIEDENLEEAFLSGGAEYRKTVPSGTLWLELQWRPVAGRWIQPDQEPSADELIARADAKQGSSVKILSPEDNLLQVCLHTAKHSYVRAPGFRLHTDVDRICRSQEIDWRRFLAEVERLRIKTACYLSLAIPHDLMGTPIPQDVLSTLEPAPWKRRMLTHRIVRAGLFGAEEKKFGRVSYIMFNALLFDEVSDLWRGLFPNKAWMRERYGVHGPVGLAYHYARRLIDLALRRVSV